MDTIRITNTYKENEARFLEFIQQHRTNHARNLTIRGMAKLAGLSDNKSLISGEDLKASKLRETLARFGFKGEDLTKNGFPPKAVWLVLEYYAYNAGRYIKPEAVQICRTFGQVGIERVFDYLDNKPSTTELELQLARQEIQNLHIDLTNMKELVTANNILVKSMSSAITSNNNTILSLATDIATIKGNQSTSQSNLFNLVKQLLPTFKNQAAKAGINPTYKTQKLCIKGMYKFTGRGLSVMIHNEMARSFPNDWQEDPSSGTKFYDIFKYRKAIDNVVANNKNVISIPPQGRTKLIEIQKF